MPISRNPSPRPQDYELIGDRLPNRLNDDLTRSPGTLEETAPEQAQAGRAGLAEAMRRANQTDGPSPYDEMRAEYDRLGQQPKPSLKQSLLRALASGIQAGYRPSGLTPEENQQRLDRMNAQSQQRQEFDIGQRNAERGRLLQEMEAERRMQEQEDIATERMTMQERMRQQAEDAAAARQQPEHMDTDQGPIQWNRNTRQWEPVTIGGQRVGPKAQPKPDTPEQQFFDSPEEAGKTMAEKVADYAAASQRPEQPQRPPQQLGITPDGQVIALRPGMTLPQGTQSLAGEMKMGQSGQAAQDALGYADLYMQGGKFSGPGDEALMEKYFELAKPSSGFRMTKDQMSMLQDSRAWMDSLRGKFYHATTGTWFPAKQRQQIYDTMKQLGQAKQQNLPGAKRSQGGGPRPGAIEDGYRFKGGDPSQQSNWERVQ